MNKINMPMVQTDGFEVVIDFLSALDIHVYSGVTGGGVVHFLKRIDDYKQNTNTPSFITIGEYTAGFIPIGYYLATGKISAAIATTGAATKLLSCGLSDAKLHDIPAVYIFPISSNKHERDCALQDSSSYGNNIIQQLKAELPEQVFVLDNPSNFSQQLNTAYQLLLSKKPVVFFLDNDVLTIQQNSKTAIAPPVSKDKADEIETFVTHFKDRVKNKRVILLVGEGAMLNPDIKSLTTAVCKNLKAAAIWSMNGVNCIASDNPYGYGCISFGGNDQALALWQSVNKDDVVLCVGLCPDEYTTNLQKISAGQTYFLTNIVNSYGQIRGSFKHHAQYDSYQLTAPIDETLTALVTASENKPFANKPFLIAPINLNNKKIVAPASGYADMEQFYQRLHQWWKPNTMVITDVCVAYKDYQYVTQRPNDNISYFSCYRGSAMGGAYGVAVGAKLAAPDKNVFLFSGDGCFRLYGSCLEEVKDLGVVLFIINNESYAIVEQGLPKIIPNVKSDKYHAKLHQVDYCAIAEASGWLSYSLASDLSNLQDILQQVEQHKSHSILINVPTDPQQILGENPRVRNL